MRNTLIISGFVVAMLTATTGSALAQADMLNYYAQRRDAAKQHCGDDMVLWLNTKTGAVSKPGSAEYGTSESGRYVCEHDVSNGRYGTRAEPSSVTPNGMTPQPAPAAPPK